MNIQVLIVSKSNEERQAYTTAVKKLNVRVDAVSSFTEARKLMQEYAYNGVLVDIKTKVKLNESERKISQEILEIFPVVQLRFNKKTRKIRTFYFGQAMGGGTLDEFINNECSRFEATKLRVHERKEIVFNVYLSKTGNFDEEEYEKTVTIDVSKGGCFIFSTNEWSLSERIYLIIKEIKNNNPILGEVRWHVPWGEAMRLPGIGVEFTSIKKNQLNKIFSQF